MADSNIGDRLPPDINEGLRGPSALDAAAAWDKVSAPKVRSWIWPSVPAAQHA
ncbi:MAG: hypothetical protein WCE30_00300 [Mycobacterium sp.]